VDTPPAQKPVAEDVSFLKPEPEVPEDYSTSGAANNRREQPHDRRKSWRGGRRESDRGKRPIVLVVDDHADCRELVGVVLGAAGIGTAEVSSGAAALAWLRTSPPPHGLIVDLRLPDLHGTDVIRQLRQDPATANVPVLVLSGLVTEADRRAASEAGAAAFLPKPVLPDELLKVVRRLLQLPDEGEKDRQLLG
jgi:CheY-like chemotaxis protein